MHPVLLNCDTRRMIFKLVETKASLSALAQTCRVVYEEALSPLWATMDDLLSLARVMDQGVWSEHLVEQQSFRGSILESRISMNDKQSHALDFGSRFHAYASYISTLVV